MKIHRVTLDNFRGYKNPTTIDFNDLTVFVGRNDIGKSTVLEALDIFFYEGKGAVKFDEGDINVQSDSGFFTISVTFNELPTNVVIDATFQTTLSDEYLLNSDGELEVIKKFNGKKCTSVLIKANHPTNEECVNLQLKKKTELKEIIQRHNIPCDNCNINSIMRRAIWKHYEGTLRLEQIDIDVTVGEDTKKIWAKLSSFLPVYSLFRADRENSDKDSEVQEPLKLAVTQFFQDAELQAVLNNIAVQVEQKLKEVSDRTLAKLREMDERLANRGPLKTTVFLACIFKKHRKYQAFSKQHFSIFGVFRGSQ